MDNNFIVISADIINSKKATSLESFYKSIEKLNYKFNNNLAAYFKSYRGDEIQCVLLKPDNFMKIIRNLRFYLKPLEIRIGIGKGKIDNFKELHNNKLENTNPWENSGQAFYFARDCLKILTTNKPYLKKPRTYFLSDINTKKDQITTINSLLNLYDIALDSWTSSQWISVHAYEDFNNLQEAASHIGKTYQSLQRSVSKSCWDEMKNCEEYINYLITKV